MTTASKSADEETKLWQMPPTPASSLYPVEGSDRDIFEVANQLGGYVDPGTEKRLARFLIREAEEASKLAYEIVRLRTELAPPQLDMNDFQLLERIRRENVVGGPRHVVEGNKELWEQAFRLSDEGLLAIEQHAAGGILHITRKGMKLLASIGDT